MTASSLSGPMLFQRKQATCRGHHDETTQTKRINRALGSGAFPFPQTTSITSSPLVHGFDGTVRTPRCTLTDERGELTKRLTSSRIVPTQKVDGFRTRKIVIASFGWRDGAPRTKALHPSPRDKRRQPEYPSGSSRSARPHALRAGEAEVSRRRRRRL